MDDPVNPELPVPQSKAQIHGPNRTSWKRRPIRPSQLAKAKVEWAIGGDTVIKQDGGSAARIDVA
jgi:hypothetical protein